MAASSQLQLAADLDGGGEDGSREEGGGGRVVVPGIISLISPSPVTDDQLRRQQGWMRDDATARMSHQLIVLLSIASNETSL